MHIHQFVGSTILLVGSCAIAQAQLPPHSGRLGAARQTPGSLDPQNQGSVISPILAGAGLGIAGFVAGGLTGAALARDCTGSEYCVLQAAFFGAAAGGTVGLAVGVHLGNHQRGSLPLDLLAGAVAWGTGIGIAAASDWDETVTWVAFATIPLAQLASTVAVERAVAHARARPKGLAISVLPHRAGGVTLAASLSF